MTLLKGYAKNDPVAVFVVDYCRWALSSGHQLMLNKNHFRAQNSIEDSLYFVNKVQFTIISSKRTEKS